MEPWGAISAAHCALPVRKPRDMTLPKAERRNARSLSSGRPTGSGLWPARWQAPAGPGGLLRPTARRESLLPHRPDHRLREDLGLGAAAEVGGAAPRIQHRGIGSRLDASGRMEELAKLMPLAQPAQQHCGRKDEARRVPGAASRETRRRAMAGLPGPEPSATV